MSATHVFRCEELAMEIFSHLAPGPLRKTDTPQYRYHRAQRRTALARAARVCRAWEVPALNVLWKVVDEIFDLLLILPSMTIFDSVCVFSRDITPAEWERFQQYAIRVRELHWQAPPTDPRLREVEPESPSISQTVWLIFSKWCQGRALCPRLQYLAPLLISSLDPGPVILASPTLRHLEITTDVTGLRTSQDYETKSLFSHLAPAFASLESLVVDSQIVMHGFTGALAPPASGVALLHLDNLNSLKHLEIDSIHLPVSDDPVRALEAMGLHSLTLTIEEYDDELFPIDSNSPLRNTLRKLCVKGDPHGVVKMVDYAAGPALEILDVRLSALEHVPLTDIPGMFEKIAAHISLRVHHISLGLSYDRNASGEHLAARHFLHPLLPKAHLTHIALLYDHAYGSFSHKDLVRVINAWPKLSVFRIEDTLSQHFQDGGVHTAPRIADLARFAKRHPELRYLVIPTLNHHLLPPVGKIPKLDHKLEILRVCTLNEHLNYASLFNIALLLDRLFPELDLCVSRSGGTVLRREPSWVKVEQTLLALQSGREGAHRS
ncbi:hypothetical protein GY45DRAFT_1272531 [Cubamyces sp. BRFM 1775]|nr:hypothetical protein GY45DRAFT_1272531 [Cubamyces sp. BRFM 1775]